MGTGTHDMFVVSHMLSGVLQLELSLQVRKQAGPPMGSPVGLQAKAPQSVTVPVAQLPMPSQTRAEVNSWLLEQVAPAHGTEPSW